MTTVTFYHDASGNMQGFQAEDHAGYAPQGQDIVCAGISALTINFINSLEALSKDRLTVHQDSHKALLGADFLEKLSLEGKLLMDSFVLGLKGIELEHPDCIKVEYKEV